MLPPDSARQNTILGALPPLEFQALAPHLQLTPLRTGAVVHEAFGIVGYVYFPIDCIVSLLQIAEDGASIELSPVSREGMVGISAFLGGGGMPMRAVVRSSGEAYRLRAAVLRDFFARGGILQQRLLRYTHDLMTHTSLVSMCARRHSIEQQVARWLLQTLDLLKSHRFTMTQEAIAEMIGVRREGVCEASKRLQRYGAIAYSRGNITILDRQRLERRACSCYSQLAS